MAWVCQYGYSKAFAGVFVFEKLRDSKTWKAIADIHVTHWIISGCISAVPAITGALHGQRLENVILYFCGAFALTMVGLRQWSKYQREMSIELIPSAGASTEIVLRILNQGKRRDFQAQCTPITVRNSLNELRRGTFDLKWEHTFDRIVPIGNDASCNLLIARVQNVHTDGFSEMEIVGLVGQEIRRFEWCRWNTEPNERLPEYDLEIKILSDGVKPVSEQFTLRPRAWYGPLEMFRFRLPFSS
jgi:hypothetical protein